MLIIVVLTGIFLSSLSSWFLYQEENKRVNIEFKKHVNQRADLLYRELAINLEALRALALIFNGDTAPDFNRFRAEAKNILARFSNIQALEWVPRVSHAERTTYELALQQHYPDFTFTEQKQPGLMIPAAERPEYYPVYYIEPLTGNESALGFDLASNPARLKALEKSRDTATPRATASITLVQEHGNQKGFLAFLPIYKENASIIKNHRDDLLGFVLGVYRINDIFKNSIPQDEALGIDMKLVDETIPSKHEAIFTHKSTTNTQADESIVYRKGLPEFWGRKWSLVASPTSHFIEARIDLLPLVVLISGIMFTFFVALYIRIISKRSITVEKMVIKLNRANKELATLARTDGLTGIANRRFMDEFLEKEWQCSARNKSSISFILIDVDFFKSYNDHYGHPRGDEVLQMISEKLNSLTRRAGDLVARYGGEEFALVITDAKNTDSLAEKCRREINELEIPHEFSEISDVVTISVGVCTMTPSKDRDSNPSELINAADKALYNAKTAGRNRVKYI